MQSSTADRSSPELSIIVPTFNERENVVELVRQLDKADIPVAWEVVFVDDDSPDGTAELVREMALRDPRVRCIQRVGRRGLSSACIEGMLSSSAPYLCVMDGDLQHDEEKLPEMLEIARQDGVDIVVGSRYVEDGRIVDWESSRMRISRLATRLGHLVVPADLADPMSGFFVITRTAFHECVRRLTGIGFKILVDLFASSPRPLSFVEVPCRFRGRVAGESKLDSQVAWSYMMLLADKTVGRFIPVRFLSFALIGATGVVVHFAVLAALFRTGLTGFEVAQAGATLVAMVSNFSINNLITYRDKRLAGRAWIRGLLSFVLVCGIGALANVGVASYLFSHDRSWLLAAFAGVSVSAVWNYAVTSFYTWGGSRSSQ